MAEIHYLGKWRVPAELIKDQVKDANLDAHVTIGIKDNKIEFFSSVSSQNEVIALIERVKFMLLNGDL
jgi:hypothetical protein